MGSLFCADVFFFTIFSFMTQSKSSAWSRGGRWGSPRGPAWSWLPMMPWSSHWGWLRTCRCLCHGMRNHYLRRDDNGEMQSGFGGRGVIQKAHPALKSMQSYTWDLWQRWEIIITNSHFEKSLLCVITTGRSVLLVIIKAHFLLPSLGQLRSVREHVNKGHPPKRSG